MNEKPTAVPIFDYSISVQIYDPPVGFRSEKVCATLGDFVGRYAESNVRNFDGSFKEFIRIWVILDVRVPLKQQMRMKQKGGDWFYVKFQYERFHAFCSFCGIIGHSEQVCEKLYDNPSADGKPLPYGPSLRASGKKATTVDHSRSHGGSGKRVLEIRRQLAVGQVDVPGHQQGNFRNQAVNCGKINTEQNFNFNAMVNDDKNGNFDLVDMERIEGIDGAIILDSKRKRVDTSDADSSLGLEAINTLLIQDKTLPNNVLGMGFGSHAHLAQ